MSAPLPAASLETSPSSHPVELAGGGRYALCLEGLPFVGGGLVSAFLMGVLVHPAAAVPFLAFSAFAAWFFRNPTRTTPADADAVISPADGVICQVTDVEENEFLGGAKATRVSIFMSVFNVHVNRTPIAGRVAETKHTPGSFAMASLDKASTGNERNAVLLETAHGKLLFVQIAGAVARRILCYAKPGDSLAAGQRFGLIRFGSRVDVYFPTGISKPAVVVGQKVVGGETVLGRFVK